MALAVPTTVTETPGASVASSVWNSQVRDGFGFLIAPPVFVGTQTTTQSLANNTWAALNLNTEQVDSYNGHSTSTNNSRYTAQVGGYYTVAGVAVFAAGSISIRGARIHVNGSVVQGSAQMFAPPSTSNLCGVATPTRVVYLNSGDYVEVAGYQLTGGSLSTGVASDLASALWVVWAHA